MSRFISVLIFVILGACADQDSKARRYHQYLLPADDFVITVRTDEAGGLPTQFTIPTSEDETYLYDVDCDDDGVDDASDQTGSYTCDYPMSGTYTIRIKKSFPHPRFDLVNPAKLISVEQWGTQPWTSFRNSFRDTDNLSINASDVPNINNVVDLSAMFLGSGVGTGSGNWNWDTSKIENMSEMFSRTEQFNQNIAAWNVGDVTNMERLFAAASVFNVDIGGWDVSKVTNMADMFSAATTFNQDLSGWNVGSAKTMDAMFLNAWAFDHDISSWNVSQVTNFREMFMKARNFNQDLGSWNVSAGTNFENMFKDARKFDQDLGSWNMQQADLVIRMFLNSGLSTWNYDAMLIGWSARDHKQDLIAIFNPTNYCLGESARAQIIANDNWTIYDEGKKCNVHLELNAATHQDLEGAGQNLPVLLIRGTLEHSTDIVISDSGLGSATVNNDYLFTSPQTISVPAGTYDGTVATSIAIPTLQILDDAEVERDETIQLILSQPGNDAEIKDANNDGFVFSTHDYTIQNDDYCTTDSECPTGLEICNRLQSPSECRSINTCGNSKLENGEFCDDGNLEIGDGCNEICKIEVGNPCLENLACASGICDPTNTPTICEPSNSCGNNVIEEDEACDDGNTINGDECDENCKLENGVECTDDQICGSGICDQSSAPARCESENTCGNNVIENDETCDDGDTVIGDGCDSRCAIENEMNCVGDRNCPEGLVCDNGTCIVECRSDVDCQTGDCILGQCLECLENEDCKPGYQCQNNHCRSECQNDDDCAPKGFCDQMCVECIENEDCLRGESCKAGICEDPNRCDPDQATCYRSCESNLDCEDPRIPYCSEGSCGECNADENCSNGEICADLDGIRTCVPSCKTDPCSEGVCGGDGLCVDCQEDQDCEFGRCDQSAQICVSECQKDQDCADPSFKKCDTFAQLCVAECIENTDCGSNKCNTETNLCEDAENEEKEEEPIDAGCGCASNNTKIHFTPLMLYLFIAFAGVRRKTRNR